MIGTPRPIRQSVKPRHVALGWGLLLSGCRQGLSTPPRLQVKRHRRMKEWVEQHVKIYNCRQVTLTKKGESKRDARRRYAGHQAGCREG